MLAGVRVTCVGRMASWASCAPLGPCSIGGWIFWQKVLAVFVLDEGTRGPLRLDCHAGAVGTHVGNQTADAFLQFDALV